MKKRRPAEGELEKLARAIVANHLGVLVDRFDDGTANAQPDALIRLPAGSAPLEVVSDVDVAHARLWDAGTKQGWRAVLEPGQPSWYVVLKNTASLKRTKAELPPVLRDLPVSWFGSGLAPRDLDPYLDNPYQAYVGTCSMRSELPTLRLGLMYTARFGCQQMAGTNGMTRSNSFRGSLA